MRRLLARYWLRRYRVTVRVEVLLSRGHEPVAFAEVVRNG